MMTQQNQAGLHRNFRFLLWLSAAMLLFSALPAEAAEAAKAASTTAWWVWPLSLFVVCFFLGMIAVPAGVGGGVLFVPIVGSFFPFHLDFVRGAGLLVAMASALAIATSSPAPRTKSRWNGKKLPTMGTNSTPPPTPAGTAIMPRKKQTTNSDSGHTHQAVVLAALAASAASAGSAENNSMAADNQSRKRKFRWRPAWFCCVIISAYGLVIEVLRMVGLGEKIPAFDQQSKVLHCECHAQNPRLRMRQTGGQQQ